jgi:Leucine-rich repeat (LRR) protein
MADNAGRGIGIGLCGTIPSEIAALSELEYLSLHTNHVSGTIPTELGELSKLRWLWLYGNDLTGTIPDEIAKLTNLKVFSVKDNDLSGRLPSLPYTQYDFCNICRTQYDCGVEHNKFVCPLPANIPDKCSAKCT